MRYEASSWYDVMQACENGHIITSTATSDPHELRKRCPECGAATLTKCPGCNTDIQGYQHVPNVAYPGPSSPPAFCHECGEPYPWADKMSSDPVAHISVAPSSIKVFLVHGHDEEMKQHVARTLTTLQLAPIILHEQPNQGRTIIEKFEKNADVGYAIILLSPDDVGYAAKAGEASAKPRARQNVVLELGYFVARLGRDRVLALKRGSDLDVPSDFSGVVYTEYDTAGRWRFELARELKALGYDIDANALL